MRTRIGAAIFACLLSIGVGAATPAAHEHERFDARHGHARYYAAPGVEVGALPHEATEAHYHGDRYWMNGGVWYRPYGPRWVVVAPPVGVFVPILPPVYTTLLIGDTSYYYANEAYYVWDPVAAQYVVVAPPAGAEAINPASPTPAAATASGEPLFIYPRNGQGDEQQAQDKYECHRWAADETRYDPTQPSGGVPPEQAAGKRADYDRARSACLEARGYTVR